MANLKGARFTPTTEEQQERPIWWPTNAVEGQKQWWRTLFQRSIHWTNALCFFRMWKTLEHSCDLGFL